MLKKVGFFISTSGNEDGDCVKVVMLMKFITEDTYIRAVKERECHMKMWKLE